MAFREAGEHLRKMQLYDPVKPDVSDTVEGLPKYPLKHLYQGHLGVRKEEEGFQGL